VIPVELELQNFLAYRNPGPLSFEGVHIACLGGPNGAGKSSLLDAITWALWGKARTNAPDELIHQGKKQMRVTLTFDQGGVRYRVIRQRKAGKRGTSLLELQAFDPAAESWTSLSDTTMRATQHKIESLLRLDYETFVNSAFLVQGRADEFTTKTPSQRKQVLANILGLSRWETFENRAKQRIAETTAEIQRLDGWLQKVESELAERPAHEQEMSQAEEAAQHAAEKLAQAEKTWASIEQTRNQLVSLQRQIDDLTRRITSTQREIKETEHDRQVAETKADKQALGAALEEVQTELGNFEPLQKRLDALAAQRASLVEKTAKLQGINQALGPETEPIKARIATLESATDPLCPTCGQPLTEEHRTKLLAELSQEVDQRRTRYQENRDQIRELRPQLKQAEREIKDLNQQLKGRADLQKKAGELKAALDHAKEAARQAENLARKIARWQKQIQKDKAQRTELEKQASASEKSLKAASLTQADLDGLRLEKRKADERVGGARQQLAALQAFETQREERLRQREALALDLGLYGDLREAFSKRGVPAMIIETAVPEIERSANELLGRMTDGRLHVRVDTQRETKGGEVREALDIIISDELGSRPYEMYSGGEAFRINFAIRIALSRLLARRAGAQLRSLFIDEGFGTQDAQGREQLVSAINSIQDDFDCILVITHIEELKEHFPMRIEVRKTPQGSLFSLT
jgi:exonuclease SbcC